MPISEDRIIRYKVEGSPTFYYTNSATIGTGNTYFIDLELQKDVQGKDPAKYLPLDSIVIKNASNNDIQAIIGGHTIIASANLATRKTNIGIRQIEITNLGAGNITAGQLRISIWLEPITEDKLLRQKIMGRFGL